MFMLCYLFTHAGMDELAALTRPLLVKSPEVVSLAIKPIDELRKLRDEEFRKLNDLTSNPCIEYVCKGIGCNCFDGPPRMGGTVFSLYGYFKVHSKTEEVSFDPSTNTRKYLVTTYLDDFRFISPKEGEICEFVGCCFLVHTFSFMWCPCAWYDFFNVNCDACSEREYNAGIDRSKAIDSAIRYNLQPPRLRDPELTRQVENARAKMEKEAKMKYEEAERTRYSSEPECIRDQIARRTAEIKEKSRKKVDVERKDAETLASALGIEQGRQYRTMEEIAEVDEAHREAKKAENDKQAKERAQRQAREFYEDE